MADQSNSASVQAVNHLRIYGMLDPKRTVLVEKSRPPTRQPRRTIAILSSIFSLVFAGVSISTDTSGSVN